MKLLVLLFCCAVALGQDAAPANPSKQKPANQYGLGLGTKGRTVAGVDILSDTRGVNFAPYLKVIVRNIRRNWYGLIPQSVETKKGKLAIEFAISNDGNVEDMQLVATSDDVVLDRAAWASITKANPFPPLPGEFTGSFLALRFRFYYNPG
jgi:TonB family protein